MTDWFTSSPDRLLGIALSTAAIYAVLVALVRLVGLRSFSKMSSFDFAMTIAVGSILASTALSETPSLGDGAAALASVFALQAVVSWLRRRTRWADRVVDNEPVVLMAGSRMLHDNLRAARVTENDVWAKLREANVLDPAEVRAVVMETTGDLSVLHGDPDGTPLAPCLLRGARDTDRVGLGPDTYDA
jgi:uncharacterized membrane protein YcaP (DUF421 family)